MNKNLVSSKKMNWGTPQWLFDKLDKEFEFTLDPCADVLNHKCRHYYTERENGLNKDWTGETVFVNPPYGKELKKWVKKASEELALVVMLIPARTDTTYWHDYIFGRAAEVRFMKGRIKFIDPETGEEGDAALFPSAIIVFNNAEETKYMAVDYRMEKE